MRTLSSNQWFTAQGLRVWGLRDDGSGFGDGKLYEVAHSIRELSSNVQAKRTTLSVGCNEKALNIQQC